MKVKQVTVVRHPELQLLENEIPFIGHTDLPANPYKSNQLLQTLRHAHFDVVLSSPLKRCAVLSEQLSHYYDCLVVWSDQLKERNFGEWDGVSKDQINPADLAAYYQSPFEFDIPGAESLKNMRQRVQLIWKEIVTRPEGRILVITHGGVMRLMLQATLGLPDSQLFHVKVDYGCQLCFDVYIDEHSDTLPFVQLTSIVN